MICNRMKHGLRHKTNRIETTETQFFFWFSRMIFSSRWITSKNRYVFVAKSEHVRRFINVLLSPLNISCSRVNTFTFEGWSWVITARNLNPTSAKSSTHLLISHFNYLPVIFVSGREHITIGIYFFKETIMKPQFI